MNIPFTIKPCVGRNGTGAKIFGTAVVDKCYAEGEVKVVSNSIGKEVVSVKQLYVDGTTTLSEMDSIVFEGRESEIKSIGYFYRNGVVDIKVVYL